MKAVDRRAELLAAEARALSLLDAIEGAGFIQAGRLESEVEADIKLLARDAFGIRRHWHPRLVRAGSNTLATAGDDAPDRLIEDRDIVFLDLGPVIGAWEADVGRSYAVGDDPVRHALCCDLAVVFDAVAQAAVTTPAITGEGLYDVACEEAFKRGWHFGGKIAGHLVDEFPHARVPGEKRHGRIAPGNDLPIDAPDAAGRERHWILEIHLLEPERRFGGFYERLLPRA